MGTLPEKFKHSCIFEPSRFQSKGNNQRLFHLRTPKIKFLSIQTLTEEFKAVVFEKTELEYRDNSKQIELLPLLVNQDSNFDLENLLHNI